MEARRSTRLIAVGAAALVVGVATATLAVRSPDGATAAPGPTTTQEAPVAPEVPAEPAPRIPATLVVPEGHEAVALQLPYDSGVAGLPATGDLVNVYGVFSNGDPAEPVDTTTPAGHHVEAVLAGVEVLAVTGPDIDAGGGNPTIVLALEPDETLKAILLQAAERTWLTLTPPDGTAPSERGIDRQEVTR